jgi:S-DNA-T family DNA segregation ATPase FtsK/SpoIIIE
LAQATRKKDKGGESGRPARLVKGVRGLREGALFLFGAMALYLMISLGSYEAADPGWSHSGHVSRIENSGGVVGAWFADVGFHLFGYFSFLIPVMVGYSGWLIFKGGKEEEVSTAELILRIGGFVLTVMAGCGLAALHFQSPAGLPLTAGGILGDVVGHSLEGPFSFVGATLFMLALFLTGVTLFTGLSWLWLMDVTGRWSLEFASLVRSWFGALREYWEARKMRQERTVALQTETKKVEKRAPPRIEPVAKKVEISERVEQEKQQPLFITDEDRKTGLPPLSILDAAVHSGKGFSHEALEAISRLVEMKLRDFGIEVEVVAVHPGPVITRFEMQPGVGVKVSQISNLAKDLARSLSAISVRVVEVIPGKTTVGLEIPNEQRETVRLSEILQSKQYDDAPSPLTLALGKDISGLPVVADLAKMPHLLVAGTTGSGKSVAINAMILSMLYKATAEEVRMIMVDPKMLELSIYEGIPHLLAPVVTDMKDAANALRWCVVEMDRRYRLMAHVGVRNITGYNKKVKEALDAGEPIRDPFIEMMSPDEIRPALEPLPYIVVVVDELADMMMVVGKKVEELIARLAQKARASGIHLLLATQRPSVDVLTGLIKANIPTRIAFQVSSKIDSRTILDQMGAESLLGHGDMLYQPSGTSVPTRVHGAFVADHEVHKVVEALKQMGAPQYIDEILEGPSTDGGDGMGGGFDGGADEGDELYDQAVRIVTESRRASVSGIQRRLKIGYNRAARMVEDMERAGVVGPMQSNGNREVLAPPPPKD